MSSKRSYKKLVVEDQQRFCLTLIFFFVVALAVTFYVGLLLRRYENRRTRHTRQLGESNRLLEAEIEKRKQREATLRKLSSAVEHSGSSVIITNREGMMEYVNPGFEDLTGYGESEVCSRNIAMLQPDNLSEEEWNDNRRRILAGDERMANGISLKNAVSGAGHWFPFRRARMRMAIPRTWWSWVKMSPR